jgi:hypothetical protein
MHTQSYQPASRSLVSGRQLGTALVKDWTWPTGTGGRPGSVGLSSLGGAAFPTYRPLVVPDSCSFQSRNWQTTQSQNSQSPLTWVCGWVQAVIAEIPWDKEVGTAWLPSTFLALKKAQRRWGRGLLELKVPLVAHNSGMHTGYQSPTWLPVLGTWPCHQMVASGCPKCPPLCKGFSSIINYSWNRHPPHCAHWLCKLIPGIAWNLWVWESWKRILTQNILLKLYLRDEKTPVVFWQNYFY